MTTKQQILALLETRRGQSISGEDIAGQLNVSRNAVWKAIKALQNDGYSISAVTNKGYCLCNDNDIISAEGILPFINEKTPCKFIVHDSLQSTSITAKEMAVLGAEHGNVVLAESQTSGRGRYERQFHSPPGGIYMSVILRAKQLCFNTPTLITAFAAVAVCEAIEAVSDRQPQIKWVNDIYLDNKKICGILTEAVTDFESGCIQWMVVGIGINFSTRTDEFPAELQDIATSLFPGGEPPITRNRLIAAVINRLLCPTLPNANALLAEYKQRMMMLGDIITIAGADEQYQATAIDIDDTGRLIVEIADGERRTLSSGEIRIMIR